jgi:hypothetical protein
MIISRYIEEEKVSFRIPAVDLTAHFITSNIKETARNVARRMKLVVEICFARRMFQFSVKEKTVFRSVRKIVESDY